eukprot:6526784-Pyramimonas_sp.AAC.1
MQLLRLGVRQHADTDTKWHSKRGATTQRLHNQLNYLYCDAGGKATTGQRQTASPARVWPRQHAF